jgi:WD40 repeat protein
VSDAHCKHRPVRKVATFQTIKVDHKNDLHLPVKSCLSPDGKKLALYTLVVELWHRESGRLLYTLPEQTGMIYRLVWSPDRTRLAVARSNGEINIWNLSEIERVLSNLELAT